MTEHGAPGFAGEFDLDGVRDAPSIQTAWLRTFLAVADQGGFGAASFPLHLSQSRVSAHIAALERVLRVDLFDRTSRPTRLTPAGEVFQHHARAALSEVQRGIEATRASGQRAVASMRIGCYPSVSSRYLPAVLDSLTGRCPGIRIELVEGTARDLEDAVTHGTVDVAFRPLLPRMRKPSQDHRAIWTEDIVAVVREDTHLARSGTIEIGDLVAHPLIGNPSGTVEDGGGFDLRRALGDRAGEADIAFLTDQPATLVALVRSGFGVGVINRLALTTTSIEGLKVCQIASPTASRDVCVFWPRHRTGSAALALFLSALECAALPEGVRRFDDLGRSVATTHVS